MSCLLQVALGEGSRAACATWLPVGKVFDADGMRPADKHSLLEMAEKSHSLGEITLAG